MATSLANDPNRNAFTAGGWQPRNLAQRSLAALRATPAGMMPPVTPPPEGLPPASALPPVAPPPSVPGMPPVAPPTGMAPAAAGETPAQALARLNSVPMQRSGPFAAGLPAGMENVDMQLLPPPSMRNAPPRGGVDALLVSGGLPPPPASGGTIQRTGGPLMQVEGGYGDRRPAMPLPPAQFPGAAAAAGVMPALPRGMPPGMSMTPPPSSLPPGSDAQTRTLSQTTPLPPPPSALTPEAFAGEAARRAVAEGRDPLAARKAAEAIRPPVAPDARTVDIGGGRRAVVGPGDKYFDSETGRPIESNRRPMAPDPITKSLDPELYEAQRAEYLSYMQEQKAAAGGADAAPDLSKPITPAQAAKLPKGTRFIGENGKTYIKN